MRASTAIAERLGELRFLDLLNRFVADVSLAVAEAGGEIHKYVGDEVIATWLVAPGKNEPACIRACFAALDRLRAQAPAYQRDFGRPGDFRAAFHCGPVAVGELGTLKKEIALIGDAMNAAARIWKPAGRRTIACLPRPHCRTAWQRFLPVSHVEGWGNCKCAASSARSSFTCSRRILARDRPCG